MRISAAIWVCSCLAASAAAVEWQDDFDGGFNQNWDFFSDDGSVNPPSHTDAVIKDDALELLGRDADYPDFDLFAGGLVGLTTDPSLLFQDAVQITATISPTMNNALSSFIELDNCDVFLLARSYGASGYVLALDRNSGSFDLVRSDNGDPDNIAPGLIVPDFDPNATYILRLTAEGKQIRGEIFDTSMNLLLDAYATDATYADGYAGVGAAINNDEALGFDRTLVTGRFDDLLATDENIVPVSPFFPSHRLDMRSPTAAALNVVEVRDIGMPETFRGALGQLMAAAPADRHEGTIATFDIHDPDSGANMGSVDSMQQPILTNEEFVDDNDFVELVSGTFEVPEGMGGDITFNIHTDDGFGMRLFYDGPAAGEDLVPVPFEKIGDRGIITPEGGVSFPHDTGDSDVQAAVNLAQGTYSFEMAWFETGGGAFAEVSTDFGDFVDNPAAAFWLLLGDEFGLPLVDGLGTGPVGLPPVGISGDYNGNGTVEQADLDLVLLNWGQPGVPAGWTNDLPDGNIDQAELDGVLLNWGNTAALGEANVPEPAAWLLALVCCLVAAASRRSRGN